MGSIMTNKYAEGYPGKRYYGGCEFHDMAEDLARNRLKQLFGAQHANVQPHSGTQANMAVYLCLHEARRDAHEHETYPGWAPFARISCQFHRAVLQGSSMGLTRKAKRSITVRWVKWRRKGKTQDHYLRGVRLSEDDRFQGLSGYCR